MWRYIYGDYLVHHHVDAVMISGRWEEADFPELGRTISWMQQQGATVILFGPVVEFDVPLPRLLAMSLRDHEPALIDSHSNTEPLQTDKKLSKFARSQWKVRYVSAYENLCVTNLKTVATALFQTSFGCPVYAARGVPLLFDTDHFTPQGSILYARTMRALNQLP
jgi:hypothetical protein